MEKRYQDERRKLRERLRVLERRLYLTGEMISQRGHSTQRDLILRKVAEEYDRKAQRYYELGGEVGGW